MLYSCNLYPQKSSIRLFELSLNKIGYIHKKEELLNKDSLKFGKNRLPQIV